MCSARASSNEIYPRNPRRSRFSDCVTEWVRCMDIAYPCYILPFFLLVVLQRIDRLLPPRHRPAELLLYGRLCVPTRAGETAEALRARKDKRKARLLYFRPTAASSRDAKKIGVGMRGMMVGSRGLCLSNEQESFIRGTRRTSGSSAIGKKGGGGND